MRRIIIALVALSAAGAAAAETRQANTFTYKAIVRDLVPGDTLVLEVDDYPGGLYLQNLNGTPDHWIVIKGPDRGERPLFLGDPKRGRNTVEIVNCSYLAIENLDIDGRGIDGIHAISAKSGTVHHIRIEGCTITDHGAHQQTVGISTKVATWGWVIRRNRIVAAGTGMYLGNSDGTDAFVGGLIEHNLFDDAKGYNVQIKHQNSRPDLPGIPTTPQRTIIRHNLFVKGELENEDGPRPNLLVDGFPDGGAGSEDLYEIYGNVFFHNHRESLLQASGRVVIHDNLFLDCKDRGSANAILLRSHNKPLRLAHVYHNTFFECDRGVHFGSFPLNAHSVVGNLFFVTRRGVSGRVRNESANLSYSVGSAVLHVANPSLEWARMDFHPKPGKCQGPAVDLALYSTHTEFGRDFNGTKKAARLFRGAYATQGANPGWQINRELKPAPTD